MQRGLIRKILAIILVIGVFLLQKTSSTQGTPRGNSDEVDVDADADMMPLDLSVHRDLSQSSDAYPESQIKQESLDEEYENAIQEEMDPIEYKPDIGEFKIELPDTMSQGAREAVAIQKHRSRVSSTPCRLLQLRRKGITISSLHHTG